MDFEKIKIDVAKLLYPKIFDDNKDLAQLNYSQKDELIFLNTKLNITKSDLEQANKKITELSKPVEVKPFDLSYFESTMTRKINGASMLLSSWLNDKNELEYMKQWIKENIDFKIESGTNLDNAINSKRDLVYGFFGNKDIHVSELNGKDVWLTPSQLIAKGFKGDCDDWAVFLMYFYQAISELNNIPEIKERLFFVLGGVNTEDGWSDGNHAYCLWQHSDGKFYVIEGAVSKGSDYIQNAIDCFGVRDFTQNIRYGRIVYMSNYNKNYYRVIL